MTRYLIHTACPETRKGVANALAGLSGRANEHSIALQSIAGKKAKEWDDLKTYAGNWWGASQALEAGIAMTMLGDGQAKKTESFYAAYDEDSGTLLGHNCPNDPADASFEAFLAAVGLERPGSESILAFPK